MDTIHHICQLHHIAYESYKPATGGDTSKSYIINAGSERYFLKLHALNEHPGMYQKEAEGLDAIRQQGVLTVPVVQACGEWGESQYLLLQFLEKATPDNSFWEHFAQGLVALHQQTSPSFGWHNNNYIGSLVQTNDPALTWPEFYTWQRIMPLVIRLYNQLLLDKNDLKAAETTCARLPTIFPDEPPSLLHGDLWSGNFMATKRDDSTVVPAIFDPAVYHGHREMDIGMTILFGGFDQQFYEAYNAAFR